MGASLRLETMVKIAMTQQEPVRPSTREDRAKCAMTLIKSGLVDKGFRMLLKATFEPEPMDELEFAVARARFLHEIEKRKNVTRND